MAFKLEMSNIDEDFESSQPLIPRDIKHQSKKSFTFNDCLNPHKPSFRYLALVFMCFITFGSFFCYDTPAALQDKFKSDLKISTATFTAFYSWYSWPNVILCFFGGFLIDHVFGIRLGTIVFSSFVLVGHVVFGFGALTNNIPTMDLGRFIFGYVLLIALYFKITYN